MRGGCFLLAIVRYAVSSHSVRRQSVMLTGNGHVECRILLKPSTHNRCQNACGTRRFCLLCFAGCIQCVMDAQLCNVTAKPPDVRNHKQILLMRSLSTKPTRLLALRTRHVLQSEFQPIERIQRRTPDGLVTPKFTANTANKDLQSSRQ